MTKLKLKKRKARSGAFITTENAREILERGLEKPAIKSIADNESFIHDREHMELIVNWTPPDGQSVMETANWVMIALKVDKIDATKDVTIELEDSEKNRILERLRHPEFKLKGVNTAFYHFLSDLQLFYGHPLHEEKEDDKSTGKNN